MKITQEHKLVVAPGKTPIPSVTCNDMNNTGSLPHIVDTFIKTIDNLLHGKHIKCGVYCYHC